jgi:hypothetical protein
MISKILMDENVLFKTQYCFPDLRGKSRALPYDFYLSAYDMVIEVHGLQHYTPMSYADSDTSFERTQRHDQMKKEYATTRLRGGMLEIDTRVYKTYEAIHAVVLAELRKRTTTA